MVEVPYVTRSYCHVEYNGAGAMRKVPYRTDLGGWDSSALGEACFRSVACGTGASGVGPALGLHRPGYQAGRLGAGVLWPATGRKRGTSVQELEVSVDGSRLRSALRSAAGQSWGYAG